MFLATTAATALSSHMGQKMLHQGLGILMNKSWKSVSTFYMDKYGSNEEIKHISHDLDIKIRVIQYPLDICSQQVIKGNEAMEGARDVAVAIMREINDLMEDINNYKIREGRKEEHPENCSLVQWKEKLKKFNNKLDSLMPFLMVAIGTANLSVSTNINIPKLDKLMKMSGIIQIAKSKCDSDIDSAKLSEIILYTFEEASYLEYIRGKWITKYMDCSVNIKMIQHDDNSEKDYLYDYYLIIEEISHEDENDDSDKDNNDNHSIEINISKIKNISWLTTQGMNLNDADLNPALIYSIENEHKNEKETTNKVKQFALQCRFFDDKKDETTIDIIENVRKESDILSDLEYLIKLCSLETKFKQCHTNLKNSIITSHFTSSNI